MAPFSSQSLHSLQLRLCTGLQPVPSLLAPAKDGSQQFVSFLVVDYSEFLQNRHFDRATGQFLNGKELISCLQHPDNNIAPTCHKESADFSNAVCLCTTWTVRRDTAHSSFRTALVIGCWPWRKFVVLDLFQCIGDLLNSQPHLAR